MPALIFVRAGSDRPSRVARLIASKRQFRSGSVFIRGIGRLGGTLLLDLTTHALPVTRQLEVPRDRFRSTAQVILEVEGWPATSGT
jgi:hypothetical protein